MYSCSLKINAKLHWRFYTILCPVMLNSYSACPLSFLIWFVLFYPIEGSKQTENSFMSCPQFALLTFTKTLMPEKRQSHSMNFVFILKCNVVLFGFSKLHQCTNMSANPGHVLFSTSRHIKHTNLWIILEASLLDLSLIDFKLVFLKETLNTIRNFIKAE